MTIDQWISKIENKVPLLSVDILKICQSIEYIFAKESNIISLTPPILVCGDIHGQFEDLIRLFELHGNCPTQQYLFLGDYVDRGSKSVETIIYLFLFKLKYPERLCLIRGNHESRQTTQIYGFFTECQHKFEGDSRVYHALMRVFDLLPIGAVIENQQLNIHGGLSPSFMNLDQLKVFNRFQEIPSDGPFCDLVWSDPDPNLEGFHLSPRGAGYLFGGDIVEKFLHRNNLIHLSRAHQLCMDGYQELFRNTLTTIWSAPNYCYRFGNSAAVMKINNQLHRDFSIFKASEENRCFAKSMDIAKTTDEEYFT